MVAAVVEVIRVVGVGDVELAVHLLERAYYLCHLGRVAEVYVSSVAVGVAFVEVFAVAHVLHVVLYAVDFLYLPYLAEAYALALTAPARTAVYNVEVHIGVVVFVDRLLQLNAVVAVGKAAVAVGYECLGSRFECLVCGPVFLFGVSLVGVVEHGVGVSVGLAVVVEYFLAAYESGHVGDGIAHVCRELAVVCPEVCKVNAVLL